MRNKEYGIWIEKSYEKSAMDMSSSHSHSCYELYFLLSGERRYLVGHKIYNVKPGELVIIPKKELHRTTSLNNNGYERYVVYFSESCLDGIVDIIGQGRCNDFLQSGCVALQPECISKIKSLLAIIAKECEKGDTLSEAITLNALQGIILSAMRYGMPKDRNTKDGADKIQEVTQYISENYALDITLASVAEMAFMEETYFSKKFKKLTGFGFKEYLIRTRIRAAEKLLLTSHLTISAVSDRCGFSGSNYFGDAFKHYTGYSPSEYVRKKRGRE